MTGKGGLFRSFRHRSDLSLIFITVLAAGVAEGGLLITENRVVDGIAGVPLVLLIPGGALIAVTHRDSKALSVSERLMWSAVASVGILVVGGLVLNLIGGLTRSSWLILSAVVVGCLGVFALLRPPPEAQVEDSLDARGRRNGNETRGPVRLTFGTVAAGLLILGLVVGSLAISQLRTPATRERFTQLWMVPVSGSGGKVTPGGLNSASGEIGIQNYEGGSGRFEVSLYHQGSLFPFKRWSLELQSGGRWVVDVRRPLSGELTATLRIRSDPKSREQLVMLPAPASGMTLK